MCLEVSFLNLTREIVRFLLLLYLEFVDEFDVEILLVDTYMFRGIKCMF